MDKLTLAIDWTPNINHIGFFVAKDKGFYGDRNIELEIVDPSTDNYEITPAKKVEQGKADFALCPTESIISYRTKSKPFDLIAIGAVLQKDLSAIVVKSDSQIGSPKDLDGKIYASYQARYEDGIVKEMVKNDGGKGSINITYPNKLGIWNTLLNGDADSTWIFLNWEGVEAEKMNHDFKYFRMNDYDIPYSYSPVIAASMAKVSDKKDSYIRFMEATKEGYLYSMENPDETTKILKKYIPEKDKSIDLKRALELSSDSFGTQENWGKLEESRVIEFLDWIKNRGLESEELSPSDIFTNKCFV